MKKGLPRVTTAATIDAMETNLLDTAQLPAKNDIARKLAKAHFGIEPGITHIFRLQEATERESLATTPIKLLEVNVNTPASGVMPLHFGPAPASGIPYPSIIIEVTPTEYQQIAAKSLQLPDGWTVSEELPRD